MAAAATAAVAAARASAHVRTRAIFYSVMLRRLSQPWPPSPPFPWLVTTKNMLTEVPEKIDMVETVQDGGINHAELSIGQNRSARRDLFEHDDPRVKKWRPRVENKAASTRGRGEKRAPPS